jgi:hypothetical protein
VIIYRRGQRPDSREVRLSTDEPKTSAMEDVLWSYSRVVRTATSERWLVQLHKVGLVAQIDYHFGAAVEATVVVLKELSDADLTQLLSFVDRDLLAFLDLETARAPFEIDGSPAWVSQVREE